MPFYARVWRQLVRNPGKTFLLWLVLFVAASLIFATTVVLSSTLQLSAELAARTQAKLVCSTESATRPITAAEAAQIGHLAQGLTLNRQTSFGVTLDDATPLTFSEDTSAANREALLRASDDWTADGPFADGSYQLADGQVTLDAGEAIVNVQLAAQNGWTLGDTLTVTQGESSQSLTIVGLFESGNEEKQSDATLAQARIENQIFTRWETAAALGAGESMTSLSVVTRQPQALDDLATQVVALLGDGVTVTTADQLYQQMAAPLTQLAQVVRLLRMFAVAAAAIVVTLLLAMWLRGRRREMAVLLSLGTRKSTLAAQVLLEAETVFVLAALAAAGVVTFAARRWGATLAQKLANGLSLSLHIGDLGVLLALGTAVVVLAVVVALAPMLCKPPKELLSEMEE